MTEPAIKVNQVSRRFGTIQALQEVSIEVNPQSLFGLLGPNGAGKTTLFSIVASFIRADAGDVEVLGVDVRRISRLQNRLAILPQDALFQRNVPILDQLMFFQLLAGKTHQEAEAEVKHTLERVGLGEFLLRRVYSLSHGMVKRLGIAQAFLGDPEVILLDEPTSGLDPKNARQIRDLILELNEARATVVISSHNLAEIQELCDHVAILDHGKVVAAGSVEDITRSGRELALHLSRALLEEEVRKLTEIPGVAGVRTSGPLRYSVSMESKGDDGGADAVTTRLLRLLLDMGITPRELRKGNALEAHFLNVTGK